MPTGPHRFGCGEIATGFKTGGFPPGYFNPPRVVPRPPGNGTPGGPRGPGPDPWGGYIEPSICPTGQTGQLQYAFCREAPCDLGEENCYPTEGECEAAIAGPAGSPGCPKIDTCEDPPMKWECLETEIPCPGFGPGPPFKYTRTCDQTLNGTHLNKQDCENSIGPGTGGPGIYCEDEDDCPEPPTYSKPTTGGSVVRFACITHPLQHCNYPCAPTLGPGAPVPACFTPTERYNRECYQCTNCVNTIVNNAFVVVCDPITAFTAPGTVIGECVWPTAQACATADPPCGNDPPCPPLTTAQTCRTTSETDCHTIWAGNMVPVEQYPLACVSPGVCFQTERECDICTCWNTAGTDCCCNETMDVMIPGPCGECSSGGSSPNCVSEDCPDLITGSPSIGSPKIPLYGG